MVEETLTELLPSHGTFGSTKKVIFRNTESKPIKISLLRIVNKAPTLNAINIWKATSQTNRTHIAPLNFLMPAYSMYLLDEGVTVEFNETIEIESAHSEMDYSIEGVSLKSI